MINLSLALVFGAGSCVNCFGETHVEDLISKEDLVSGICQNLCYFFGILDFSHIEIG